MTCSALTCHVLTWTGLTWTGADLDGADLDGADLAGLDEAQARHSLVGQTALFTASFLRWMEDRAWEGMNYARLRLLQALHCGGPAIMRDLGTQLGTTPRNMTAIVDALEEAQLGGTAAAPDRPPCDADRAFASWCARGGAGYRAAA